MFSRTERMIAFRYLRARKQEGFISVIAGFSLVGIALGVATLIVVMAVMNGFREELITRILGVDGHITVVGGVDGVENYQTLADTLESRSDIVRVTPMVEGQVMLAANDRASGALVRGISREELARKELLAQHIAPEVLEVFEGHHGVILGHRLAQRLQLFPGDEVTLVSPRTRATVMGAIPRMKSYPVLALLDLGMFEYDNSLVLVPLESAQLFFQLPKTNASMLEVMTPNPMMALEVAHRVEDAVPPYYRVVDWQRRHFQFFNALKVERNVMFLILTLIILVAAFNIISSLIMLVRSKTGDIAILRTMGAPRGSVLRIFFLCGASIGVIGTVVGSLLGLAFALNIETIRQWLESFTGTELFAAEIYFLSTLPAVVKWDEVVQVVAMALVLSFLATIYPAWRAAKTDPAEALRYG